MPPALQVYLDAILARGDRPFDAARMEQTFARYWDYASYVVDWTNSCWRRRRRTSTALLGAAGQAPALAGRIANGFDNPPDFFPGGAMPGPAMR